MCPCQIQAYLPKFHVKSDFLPYNEIGCIFFSPAIKPKIIFRLCLQKALLDTTESALLRQKTPFSS